MFLSQSRLYLYFLFIYFLAKKNKVLQTIRLSIENWKDEIDEEKEARIA